MINLLLYAARLALEASVPVEVQVARVAFNALTRRAVVRRLVRRGIRRGVRRMGILDASLSTIRRGAVAATEEAASPPTRILPPTQPPGEFPLSAPSAPERIPVPPNAYPSNPIQGNSYFQSNRFTNNVYNSKFQTSPGPTPPQPKDPTPDPKLNNLVKADIAANLLQAARSGLKNWFPTMSWEGVVHATGFKTTPTRTVVHYALAVAYGLIKQQRVSGVSLRVDVDYETNHVTVAYISETTILTELLTLSIYAINGFAIPPALFPDLIGIQNKTKDVLSRSLTAGFKMGGNNSIIELGSGVIQLAGDALKFIVKAYDNLSRLLGPVAVYDMGDDTLYGGRASFLLRAKDQPEPFNSMQTDKNGKPVPLLTRLPAPNPQPPVAIGTDPSSGYSLDLRSLVAQALYDPGVVPPVPDTNVSLPTVF